MRTLKLKLSGICSLILLLLSAVIAITCFNGAKAQENVLSNVNLQMQDGVRIQITGNATTGYNSICYEGRISIDDYNKLKNTENYDSVEFGMIILPKAYADENPVSEATVFGNDAVYDWATWNGSGWEYNGSKKRIVLIPNNIVVGDNDVKIKGALSDIKEADMNTQWSGVAYIKAEKGSSAEYKFSDLVTAIPAVAAQEALNDYGEQKEIKDYIVDNFVQYKNSGEVDLGIKVKDNQQDYDVGAKILKVVDSAGTEIENAFEGNSVKAETFKSLGIGEKSIKVYTEQGFKVVKTVNASHIVTTPDEFESALDYKTFNNNSHQLYVVLGNDIDFNGVSFAGKARLSASSTSPENGDYFYGIFDGNGYNIKNISIPSTKTIFGVAGSKSVDDVTYTGTIRNVSFTNIISANAWSYLTNIAGGKLDNIYYQGTEPVSAGSTGSVVQFIGGGSIQNCVFNQTFTYNGETSKGTIIGATQGNSVTNTYYVGNATSVVNGESQSVDGKNLAELLRSHGNKFTSANGWKLEFTENAYSYSFGKSAVEIKTPSNVAEKAYVVYGNGAVLNLANASADIEYAALDGEKISITDNKLLCADLSCGDHELIYAYGDTFVSQPFVVATHILAEETDFATFMSKRDAAAGGETKDWYVVLSNDIELSGKTSYGQGNTDNCYFSGTLDGQGYAIKNVVVNTGKNSLLGKLSSTSVLKNIAFINLTATQSWSYCISSHVYGTISNVYVQGDRSGGSNVLRLYSGGKVENCIFNITSDENTKAYIDKQGGAVTVSVYGIGSIQYLYGKISDSSITDTTTENCYSDLSSFMTEKKDTITAANGFKHFTVDGDKLSFGSISIYDGQKNNGNI